MEAELNLLEVWIPSADTADLKSADLNRSWGFKSPSGHQHALTQIKNEAFQHSQVMENLFYISEVYGPRVTNSRNHRAAAEWAMQQMKDVGPAERASGEMGAVRRWMADQEVYGALESPAYAALIGFPLAWTPGTNGPVTAEAVLAPLHSEATLPNTRASSRARSC
jgi:hypothetical protein